MEWAYFLKLPLTVGWNLLFLGIFTIQLLWRVKWKLWDPRTWLTVFLFYVIANAFLLFFQVGLDLSLLLARGKTLTGFLPDLGNYLSNYGLSSAITTLVFTALALYPVELALRPGTHLRLLRADVLEEIRQYNKEYIVSRVKRGLVFIALGVVIAWILGLGS